MKFKAEEEVKTLKTMSKLSLAVGGQLRVSAAD